MGRSGVISGKAGLELEHLPLSLWVPFTFLVSTFHFPFQNYSLHHRFKTCSLTHHQVQFKTTHFIMSGTLSSRLPVVAAKGITRRNTFHCSTSDNITLSLDNSADDTNGLVSADNMIPFTNNAIQPSSVNPSNSIANNRSRTINTRGLPTDFDIEAQLYVIQNDPSIIMRLTALLCLTYRGPNHRQTIHRPTIVYILLITVCIVGIILGWS